MGLSDKGIVSLFGANTLAMATEARKFGLGATNYYFVLTSTAVLSQLTLIGSRGLIFGSSSFTTGVFAATLAPMTEIAAVFLYQEKFTREKGTALALSLWGFASYLYGSYRGRKKLT